MSSSNQEKVQVSRLEPAEFSSHSRTLSFYDKQRSPTGPQITLQTSRTAIMENVITDTGGSSSPSPNHLGATSHKKNGVFSCSSFYNTVTQINRNSNISIVAIAS